MIRAAAGTATADKQYRKAKHMNCFYRIVMETLKTHYPNSDHRCVCGQVRDDWEWADHATDEVAEALTNEIGLAAEMGQDPDNHHIITRYVTSWHEG
jgi:hypothetical protein